MTNHKDDLREMGERAKQVAALISQGPLDQFQNGVPINLRPHGPEFELQEIERRLLAVAAAINSYLMR